MNDAFLVSCFERFTNVLRNVESLFDGNAAALEALRERLAFDKLENKKTSLVGFLKIVDRCDVWMIERREDFRLPLKTGSRGLCRG